MPCSLSPCRIFIFWKLKQSYRSLPCHPSWRTLRSGGGHVDDILSLVTRKSRFSWSHKGDSRTMPSLLSVWMGQNMKICSPQGSRKRQYWVYLCDKIMSTLWISNTSRVCSPSWQSSLKEPSASTQKLARVMLSTVKFSTISNLVTKWRITRYDLELKIWDLRGRSKKGNPTVRIYISKLDDPIASNLSIATGIMIQS